MSESATLTVDGDAWVSAVPDVLADTDIRLESMKGVASAVSESAALAYLVHSHLATV